MQSSMRAEHQIFKDTNYFIFRWMRVKESYQMGVHLSFCTVNDPSTRYRSKLLEWKMMSYLSQSLLKKLKLIRERKLKRLVLMFAKRKQSLEGMNFPVIRLQKVFSFLNRGKSPASNQRKKCLIKVSTQSDCHTQWNWQFWRIILWSALTE